MSSSKALELSALNWTEWKYDPDASLEKAMRETDWDRLCQRASSLRDGRPCAPLENATNGLNNAVRLLRFDDGTLWVARIAMRTSAAALERLSSEIGVMQWIHDESTLPVPQVFDHEANTDNPVGVPFVLMEFIPGNTVMNAGGGYEVHHGIIPKMHRPRFYRAVAECHVKMTALRLPKIGTIQRMADGKIKVGPFPDIGGPFDTATDFLKAWAGRHKTFPRRPDEILDIMRGGPAQEVLGAIETFPQKFKEVAPRAVRSDAGPFPLCHSDFLHSNIISDDDSCVSSTSGGPVPTDINITIIDWEGACTLPLELVRFPRFLETPPRLFNSPDKYRDSQPIDDDERERWAERQDYIQMVKSFEGNDRTLSSCLEYEQGQALSYVMEAYENGKMGFYDRVMDGLEETLGQ